MTGLLSPVIAACEQCPWEQACNSGQEAAQRLAQHLHLRHDQPLPPQEVTGAGWQERAADAVQQVAARGQTFTLYAALAEFGLQNPPNAKTALGRFAGVVHDLGFAHPVGYAPSERAGTKRSAAAVWSRDGRRCVDAKCRRRAGAA